MGWLAGLVSSAVAVPTRKSQDRPSRPGSSVRAPRSRPAGRNLGTAGSSTSRASRPGRAGIESASNSVSRPGSAHAASALYTRRPG